MSEQLLKKILKNSNTSSLFAHKGSIFWAAGPGEYPSIIVKDDQNLIEILDSFPEKQFLKQIKKQRIKFYSLKNKKRGIEISEESSFGRIQRDLLIKTLNSFPHQDFSKQYELIIPEPRIEVKYGDVHIIPLFIKDDAYSGYSIGINSDFLDYFLYPQKFTDIYFKPKTAFISFLNNGSLIGIVSPFSESLKIKSSEIVNLYDLINRMKKKSSNKKRIT